jgi:hypothetical protein
VVPVPWLSPEPAFVIVIVATTVEFSEVKVVVTTVGVLGADVEVIDEGAEAVVAVGADS